MALEGTTYYNVYIQKLIIVTKALASSNWNDKGIWIRAYKRQMHFNINAYLLVANMYNWKSKYYVFISHRLVRLIITISKDTVKVASRRTPC